jgi:hypothetical protein
MLFWLLEWVCGCGVWGWHEREKASDHDSEYRCFCHVGAEDEFEGDCSEVPADRIQPEGFSGFGFSAEEA